MSHDAAALQALTVFELRRGLARPGARMGFGLFVAAVAIGSLDYWFGNGDPGLLFGEGFLIWMIGLVGFGLAADRRRAFDEYLIRNHVSARVYLAAKAIAMVGLILGAGLVAFAVRIPFTGGDVAGSLWSASVMTLIALLVAPAAMIVEGQADTSMPAAFVILGYGIVGALWYLARRTIFVFELVGLDKLAHGSWASVVPLAARVAIGIVPAFLIAGALVYLSRRRY